MVLIALHESRLHMNAGMGYYFKREKECVNMHKTGVYFSFSQDKLNEEHGVDSQGLRCENTAALPRPEEIKPHFMQRLFFICLRFFFFSLEG